MSKLSTCRNLRVTARVLSVIVLGLAVVACGGGGEGDKVAAEGDAASPTTAEDGASGAGAEADGGAPSGTDGTVGTDGAKVASGGTGTGGTGGGTTTVSARNVVDTTPGLPPAGSYAFHTSGTMRFGANPEQPVDLDTTTTMVHLGGGRIRQTSADQESVLQWNGAQVLLHTMDLTRPGFERHFEAKPPVQYAPVDLVVGQTWTWQLTATNLPTTIKQESSVDRLETVNVGGRPVKAIVVTTKLTISGDVSGTIDLTQWIDTANDLPARVHAKTNIVTYTFMSDTTSDFTGFTPS